MKFSTLSYPTQVVVGPFITYSIVGTYSIMTRVRAPFNIVQVHIQNIMNRFAAPMWMIR